MNAKNYNIPAELGKQSYWANKGHFRQEYDILYKEHVPDSGHADNLFGEVIRAVSCLGYEYFNNGNCNAKYWLGVYETCPYCHGNGYDDDDNYCPYCGGEAEICENDEYDISEFYSNFIELIYDFFKRYKVSKIGDKYLDKIKSIIVSEDNMHYFCDENEQAYDAIVDIVVAVILGEGMENSPKLPDYYKN